MKELEQLKFLNLKIQEATSKSVAITEKLVTTNKTAPPHPPTPREVSECFASQ